MGYNTMNPLTYLFYLFIFSMMTTRAGGSGLGSGSGGPGNSGLSDVEIIDIIAPKVSHLRFRESYSRSYPICLRQPRTNSFLCLFSVMCQFIRLLEVVN